jgi:hypothetical protein
MKTNENKLYLTDEFGSEQGYIYNKKQCFFPLFQTNAGPEMKSLT